MLEGVFKVQRTWQLPEVGGRLQSIKAAAAAFAWGRHLGVRSILLRAAADPSGMKSWTGASNVHFQPRKPTVSSAAPKEV